MTDRVAQIQERLTAALAPSELQIRDQSHLHAGHAGARDGRGHFAVTIVSDKFEGASRIARHKMVYDALGDLLNSDIHAVQITARTPSER
jgi:BolA family transcriptional regulator, general stress-responsive regulator